MDGAAKGTRDDGTLLKGRGEPDTYHQTRAPLAIASSLSRSNVGAGVHTYHEYAGELRSNGGTHHYWYGQ